MNRQGTVRFLISAFAVIAFIIFCTPAPGQEDEERAALEQRVHDLSKRVDLLRSRQDYLVFQRAMASSDSKYVVIDPATQTGHLKYKTRVLKDFSFKLSAQASMTGLKPGLLTLTKKTEDARKRNALIFGDSLVVRWKWSFVPKEDAALPALVASKRDLLSLYYALEEGSLLYVVR